MKKTLSAQVVILICAASFAIFITAYIGSFTANPFLFYWNTLLVNITFMGDGFFALGLYFFLLFYFRKKELASKLLITLFFTLFIVQLIKNVFSNLPFHIFFETSTNSNELLSLYNYNFISSHTAIAFTLAIFFAMQIKKVGVIILVFLLASFISYSRIVLVGELYVAICFGLIPAFCSYVILKYFNFNSFSNKGYFRRSKSKKLNMQQQISI